MAVLYVTQTGAEVRKRGARLRVEWQGQVLASLPVREVERVVLVGPVQLSAAATQLLLRARIPVAFASGRGRYYGSLTSGGDNAELLLAQVSAYQDESFRLETAKALVGTKIRQQRGLLLRYARNHPDPSSGIAQRLREAAEHLEVLRSRLTACASSADVMGLEGRASTVYFQAFGACLRAEGISFQGRNRRPPRDPVNALLSLGYMLALLEALGALQAQGLHPGIGFLHEVSRRHPALALDLLELVRQPLIDRLTLSLFNRRVLTPQDFSENGPQGVRLRDPSRERYLRFYERAMTTPFRFRDPCAPAKEDRRGSFRDWLHRQAEALRRALERGEPWTPLPLEL